MKYTNELIDNLINTLEPTAIKIDESFKKGIAIYGAGFVGTWALQYLKSMGANVVHFIDRDKNKDGKEIDGVKIIQPDNKDVVAYPTILIASRHAISQVTSLYDDKEPYVVLSFDGYYVVKNYGKFKDVRDNYLGDEDSKNVYNALLYSMLTGDVKSCCHVMEKDMYFSIPEFSATFDETFVDAGAFVGDSVERFIWENLGTFRHLYAFEPGEKQFAALEYRMNRLIQEWAINPETVTLVKAGLSDKKDEMSCIYTDDYMLRHTLSDIKTNDTVATYSLDEFLEGKPVSFIKVDIEGMEMDFLRGAVKTIQANKPKLALCAYHYPCDLFSLAYFVKEICPDYKFKLRLYAPFFGDFVLYCYC